MALKITTHFIIIRLNYSNSSYKRNLLNILISLEVFLLLSKVTNKTRESII